MHAAQSVIQARLLSAKAPTQLWNLPFSFVLLGLNCTFIRLAASTLSILPVTDSLVSDSFQGIVNFNGPIILGRMRDTVAWAIQWDPSTGESIHGSLQVLKSRF
jgi:hypothetical protein